MLLKKGQSLVELLIAIGLTAVLIPALLTGLISSRGGKPQQNQRVDAVNLLKETEEAIKNVRDAGWANITTNGTYYPQISGNSWSLVSGIQSLNGFSRSIVISDVYRDPNGSITTSGGTLDPSTKKAELTISWSTPFASSARSTIYLTRHQNNMSYTETTKSEFDQGTYSSTTSTNDNGGEVILTAGGHGDWCQPNLTISALDLPKSGAANAVNAIEGRVFAGTGDDSSGVSFANINITDTDPPVATIVGTFDGFKTNAIFGETNYAYLASDNNFKEIAIVDLTTNPYTEAGYFNAPFNQDGNGVFVVGNVGYMTTGNMFYTFDLSSKLGSRPQLDSLLITIFGTARKIYVVGNYAYIAVDGYAFKELSIVNISNPSNIHEVGSSDVNSAGGKEVYVNADGTRAYLATSADSSKKEFFIIDTSTKTGNRPVVGSYEAGGMSPRGVTIATGNKAILVGTGAEEYQAIDISNETNPIHCGGLNIDSGVRGVSTVLEQDGDAYSYIVTGDAAAELKIVEGQPVGQSSSGIFESRTFDAGYQTAFNRFDATFSKPASTNIQFQVASQDAISGNCNGVAFSFVGPDGTSGTFFTDGGSIPLSDDGIDYENPGRCFRYKLFLSTADFDQTPVFNDITVNYSL